MKRILCMIATILSCVSAEATEKKGIQQNMHGTKESAARWSPETYSEEIKVLPAKYEGTNAKKMYTHLVDSLKALERGEFETTQAFESRTADKEAIIKPLNFKDLYAFSVGIAHLQPKYDADAQEYLIGGAYGQFGCRRPPKSGSDREWMSCSITSIRSKSDKYMGSNAYGLSKEIQRTRGHDFSIAVSTYLQALDVNAYFTEKNSVELELSDRVPVPINKAVSLKNKTIRALLVGRLLEARLIEGVRYAWNPTISRPSDMLITEESIPFEIRKVVYFVYETGEVLFERNFR